MRPTPRDLRDVAGIATHVAYARLGGPPTRGTMALAVRRDGHLLLVQSTYRRAWGLPGGFLDADEDPVAGAIRELREETGVELHQARLTASDERRFHHDHLVAGLANHEGPFASTWEIRNTEWVDPSALHQRSDTLSPHTKRMLRFLPGGTRAYVRYLLASDHSAR